MCRDPSVCRVVDSALAAVGAAVEHHLAIPDEPGEVALFVVDRASRQATGDALRAASAPVVIVGDDLEDDALIRLMLEAPVSHLLSDPGDRELGITSNKLVTGDMFGLEKYVAAGAVVGQRLVASDMACRLAVNEVTAWAEGIGARRPILHRLANVVDELLMNALHDAPREAHGGGDGGEAPPVALLRWGHDAHTLAISVSDGFGALSQRDVIDHVRRARDERGRPRPATVEQPGAGLGLYLVLANVASLIVNVTPGQRTEVVCLFDLARGSRRAISSGVRSLHVFHAHASR